MTERWLPIEGFEGIYEVSDLGRVRRVFTRKATKYKAGHILTPTRHRSGYRKVILSNAPAKSQRTMHAIVARAFLGPRPDGCDINHKNGNKTDNRADNLEYISRMGNIHHAMNVLGHSNAGERHGQATLTKEKVVAIRSLRERGKTLSEIANQFGICFQTVSCIARRKSWKHV
jgi:NUMOD4 motif-containing protein/HNH endonuclease